MSQLAYADAHYRFNALSQWASGTGEQRPRHEKDIDTICASVGEVSYEIDNATISGVKERAHKRAAGSKFGERSPEYLDRAQRRYTALRSWVVGEYQLAPKDIDTVHSICDAVTPSPDVEATRQRAIAMSQTFYSARLNAAMRAFHRITPSAGRLIEEVLAKELGKGEQAGETVGTFADSPGHRAVLELTRTDWAALDAGLRWLPDILRAVQKIVRSERLGTMAASELYGALKVLAALQRESYLSASDPEDIGSIFDPAW